MNFSVGFFTNYFQILVPDRLASLLFLFPFHSFLQQLIPRKKKFLTASLGNVTDLAESSFFQVRLSEVGRQPEFLTVWTYSVRNKCRWLQWVLLSDNYILIAVRSILINCYYGSRSYVCVLKYIPMSGCISFAVLRWEFGILPDMGGENQWCRFLHLRSEMQTNFFFKKKFF